MTFKKIKDMLKGAKLSNKIVYWKIDGQNPLKITDVMNRNGQVLVKPMLDKDFYPIHNSDSIYLK
jgi:hypothetical protein